MIKNNYVYDEKYVTIYTNQYTSISLDRRWQEKPEKAIYTYTHIYIYIYTSKYKYIRYIKVSKSFYRGELPSSNLRCF